MGGVFWKVFSWSLVIGSFDSGGSVLWASVWYTAYVMGM